MKTAQKIALARLVYHLVHGARAAVGRGDETIVRRKGLRYRLDLAQGIDFSIWLLGAFEPKTAAACMRNVRAGQCVLDIGANIGAHTLTLARQVGRQGRVLAFEPTAYAFGKLQANLALNPEFAAAVTTVQCFLGPKDSALDTGAIYSSWPLTGGKDLHAKHLGEPMPTAGAVQRSLDSVLAEQGRPVVHFVKMDVDGYECDVLAGAREMMTRDRPVFVMEISPYVLEERGASLAQFLGFFLPLGYRLYRESDESPLPLDPAALTALIGDGASINAIARAG